MKSVVAGLCCLFCLEGCSPSPSDKPVPISPEKLFRLKNDMVGRKVEVTGTVCSAKDADYILLDATDDSQWHPLEVRFAAAVSLKRGDRVTVLGVVGDTSHDAITNASVKAEQ